MEIHQIYCCAARTCTGLAATNKPATPPPTTRPSGLAKETLMPPDLFLIPPVSEGMNEPVNDSISKRPCSAQQINIKVYWSMTTD